MVISSCGIRGKLIMLDHKLFASRFTLHINYYVEVTYKSSISVWLAVIILTTSN